MLQDLVGKKLLILGGNYVDRKLVETAKRMGIVTYITDINPIERSPAKIIADYKYEYNSADIDNIIELCRQEEIDGVLSLYHDFSQTPCRIICEKLGLPHFGNKKQYEILSNKFLFKQFCEKAGLGTIPYYSEKDFVQENSDVDYPVIVKPCDGRGSKGQTICNSRETVLKAIEFAKSFSRLNDVVIEKYLGNKNDLELAYIVTDGEPVLVKIGDRHLGDKSNGLDKTCIASFYPSKYENFYRENINPKVVEGLRKLNLVNAPIFVQGFFCDDTVKFYDPGIRLPGDDFDVGYKTITGIDIAEMFIRFALTGRFPKNSAEKIKNLTIGKFGKFMAMILPAVCAGKIHSIRGIEEIEKNPAVVSFATFYREGDTVAVFNDARQRFAEFIIVGNSVKQLKEIIEWIFNTIKVSDSEGNDMLTAKFDYNLLDNP